MAMYPTFLTVLSNPEKYAEWVPIEKCTVAGVIDEEKVFKFVKLLMRGKEFKPLVGVINPFGDDIAVADGHHRFHAYRRIGHDKVLMAVSHDPLWFPIVSRGLNQLTPAWQVKARRQLRKLKCWLFRREDWGA